MIKTSKSYNDKVLTITLTGNDVNSIKISMLKDLYNVLHDINFTTTRIVIFNSDRKHFCAGADLKERSTFNENETIKFLDDLNELYHKVQSLEIPTISIINGACLGGGLELALSCDFRIGYEDSIYSFPEASIGIIPGAGGTQRITNLIGLSKSMEWIFSSNKYTANEALKYGVIDFIVNKYNYIDFINNFIIKIIDNAPLAIKSVKKSINAAFIDHGFKIEREEYLKVLKSDDRDEGLESFKEKRKPNWKNN